MKRLEYKEIHLMTLKYDGNTQWLHNFAHAIMDAMEAANKAEPVAWAETDEHGEIAWGEEGCFSNDPTWIENPVALYTTPQPDRTAELEAQVKVLRDAVGKVSALRGNIYESESKGEMQALIDAFMACDAALAHKGE